MINCIAKVSIDYCEKKFDEAKLINFKLVEFLSKMSKKFKFKLVQISTDHVYKGRKFKLNNEKVKFFLSTNTLKVKFWLNTQSNF